MATPVRSRGVTYGNQFIQARVFWDDSGLRGAGRAAFVIAGRETAALARSLSPSSHVARSTRARFFSGGAASGMDLVGIVRASSPLAHLFELGVDPHPIAPKNSLQSLIERGRTTTNKSRSVRRTAKGKIAMKFPDGGFARGTVQHPGMAEHPFLRPAAAAFPGFFNRAMSAQLRF